MAAIASCSPTALLSCTPQSPNPNFSNPYASSPPHLVCLANASSQIPNSANSFFQNPNPANPCSTSYYASTSFFFSRRRRSCKCIHCLPRSMAPEEEKMTRRSPLDFPIEWERPRPGRRPDIFPQFSPMKTPLPQPPPTDPPEEDEEEEEKKEEEKPEEEPEKSGES